MPLSRGLRQQYCQAHAAAAAHAPLPQYKAKRPLLLMASWALGPSVDRACTASLCHAAARM